MDVMNSIARQKKLQSFLQKKKLKLEFLARFTNQGGIDKDVLSNFDETIEKLKSSGSEIVDIELPNIHHSLAVYYVLMPAEISSIIGKIRMG